MPRKLTLYSCWAACAVLSHAAVAHGPLVCLQDKDGRTIKLVGISHGEAAQNIQVDVLQAIDDAKQVLLETDPDTVVDYVKQNIKANDWPPMDQGLTEETKARLTKFLSAPADFLHKPNVMGKIFGYIYARGMSRPATTLFPVSRWENLLSLEKSIKRKFTSRKLSINEIEGAESYSKTMREFALVDYDALVNAAIDCAEKSACMKNWEKINSEAMDGNFGEGYDEYYRRFHIYPSLATRTLPTRNAVMHKNIVNLSGNSSGTLVVVGAGHIGGPSGLLNLLNGDGFKPAQCN